MRFRLTLAAVILQVVVLAFMAGERELVIHNGHPILLRTAPVDPNDPMRGDYVRLSYDISNVPKELCRDGTAKMVAGDGYIYSRQWRDTRVYAVLKQDAQGIATLDYLTDAKPAHGLFMRGRIDSVNDHQLTVRYGIEAYFMQQGVAQKLEDTMRRERPGCPLNMRVALGESGIAVLQDHHWEPLGLTVDFVREPAADSTGPQSGQANRRIVAVNVRLKNYGSEDVAIVDLPAGGSFHLVPDSNWNDSKFRSAEPAASPLVPEAAQLILLKPGQVHLVTIDLRQPRWYVVDLSLPLDRQKPMPLADITANAWAARFRIEYTPPSPEHLRGLPGAAVVFPGSLRSQAFNAVQGWD